MIGVSRPARLLTAFLMAAAIAMTQTAAGAADAASDPQMDPRVRTFLAEHSSPFFWELLPGPQVRAISTGLQARTPDDLSDVTEHGRNIELHTLQREKAADLLCRPRIGGFSLPD
jgi:hypothetical protein